MSLRWKIALALAAIGLVATASVGIIGYRTTERRLVTELDRSLEATAVLLAGRPVNSRVPQRLVIDVYGVRRIDPSGEVVATSFDAPVPVDADAVRTVIGQRSVVVRHSQTAPSGERYRVHTIGLDNGAFEIARSLDEVDAVLADLRQRTVLLVVLVSGVSALLGWLIAGRVAAPLRRLATSADEVRTTGRLDVALPVERGGQDDEVGRLSRAFASMLDALDRSRADQERLAQDAGHELRTPLTSLRTNLAVLRRHDDMPAEMRAEILADLDGEVSELTDLVNELVTVASGQLTDQPSERIDAGAACTTVAQRVRRRRAREIEVRAEPGADVLMPRAALDRAISNLLDNACKFDTSGHPIEVTVDVLDGPDGQRRVAVRVLDRGPGVPAADLDSVFDRFHRADSTRTRPGSGLGLAIVREVVTANGGSVVAANRDSGGAAIGFDLPLADGGT